MKKNAILSFVTTCTGCFGFSQEILWEVENPFKKSSFPQVKESFQVVNSKTNEISLFLIYEENVYACLLNEQYNLSKTMVSQKLPPKYKVLLGSSISKDGLYHLFMANENHKKFGVISFSYDEKESKIKELELDLKNQKFIQTVSYNDNFYIITTYKNESGLNIYLFDEELNYTSKKIDLSRKKFTGAMGETKYLYDLLTTEQVFSKNIDIEKIDDATPNSIESTSAKTKMYVKEGRVIFTFDVNKDYTQILTISLDDFTATTKVFNKTNSDSDKRTDPDIQKSNTFIADDKLYMIGGSPKKMIFTINDYETGNLLKKYEVLKEGAITFKNTPIIQEGGVYDKYRELERTAQFLRKITTADIGVAVYKKNDGYTITLGGKSEIKNGGGMMMPMGFGAVPGIPIATVGSATIFFNPTYFAYNGYTNTKSTYVNCLFDSNFEHIEGEVEKNAFDKVKEFSELPENKNIKAETLFKYKDYFIFGYYIHKTKKYSLVKFQD